MTEWIIPCNVTYYRLRDALVDLKIIDWHQEHNLKNAQVGDIIYIYCTKPVQSVCYKGAILAVNKKVATIDDSQYSIPPIDTMPPAPCMEIAVFREYDLGDELTLEKLHENGLKGYIQGSRRLNGTPVLDYLHKCDIMQRNVDRFVGTISDACLVDFPIAVDEGIYENKQQHNIIIPSEDDKVWAMANSKTYDIINKYCVHAHPVNGSYPKDKVFYFAPINKGGIIENIYTVKKIVVSLPIAAELEKNTQGLEAVERAGIMKYHLERMSTFGYAGDGQIPFRFYVLELFGKVEQPCIKSKIRAVKTFDISEFDFEGNVKTRKQLEIYEDENLQADIEKAFKNIKIEDIPVDYKPMPVPLSKTQTGTVYKRNRSTAIQALALADYKCEIDRNHMLFKRKNKNVDYTEAHHLIPLSAQSKFNYSLDVPANIVSLCCVCHRIIHFGEDSEKLLTKLYYERKDQLKAAGIEISLEELLDLYR